MAGKPARKSRILASLDNPTLSPSAATSSSSPLAHTSLGLGPYQTPSNMHMDTSSLTQDEEAMLSIIRRGQKRKFYGPEMILDDDSDAEASGSSPPPFPPLAPRAPGQFSIRYDQESMVRSIDRGGHDQETKCVLFAASHLLLSPKTLLQDGRVCLKGHRQCRSRSYGAKGCRPPQLAKVSIILPTVAEGFRGSQDYSLISSQRP